MKLTKQFWWKVAEGILAFAVLILSWPLLLLMALFIRTTSEGAVITTDQWPAADGRNVRACRFRTTGPGLQIFQAFARLARYYSIDELPSLWNVVHGEVRLRDLGLFRLSPK
jgi:lipopolysaccharide/colanic/teichoic acid biosynthesis glycosyltransferase